MTSAAFGRRVRTGSGSSSATAARAPTVSAPASTLAGLFAASTAPAEAAIDAPPQENPPYWVAQTLGQQFWGVVIFAGFLAALCFLEVPHLMRDVRLASTYEIDPSVKINRGECTGYTFIHACNVTYQWEDDKATTISGETRFLVTALSMDRQPLIPVRSSAEPGAVSVLYATDDGLQNRIYSMLFWAGLCVLAIVALFVRILRGRYTGGAADVWTV